MVEFKKAFIDTGIFVYLLERNPLYYDKAKKVFSKCVNKGMDIVTSVITYEEYCVYPYRNNQNELVQNFEEFLMDMNIEILSVDTGVAKTASMILAKYNDIKDLEALQVATAIVTGCDVFFTDDMKFKQIKEVGCVTLDEI